MRIFEKIPDAVLIIGGLVIVVVLDELGKNVFSLYLVSYLPMPLVSYYLVIKYGRMYNFPYLKVWKGAAILASYLVLPILYWRVWQEKKAKNQFYRKTHLKPPTTLPGVDGSTFPDPPISNCNILECALTT